MEFDKDAEKKSLKEAALREQKEAVAATEPKKAETPHGMDPDMTASPEMPTPGESAGEKLIEQQLLTDVEDALDEEPPGATLDQDAGDESSKYRIEFYGSEILRAKAPKVFDVADAVADDWIKDGRFEAIPVGHPLAQLATQVGLRKAKDIEKKLDEKGVFLIARTGFEFLKSKIKR